MKTIIYEIGQKRDRLLKLFISSIVLAFSVGLIANYCCNPSPDNVWALWVGCGIIAVVFVIYIIYRIVNRKRVFAFKGTFAYDENKNMVSLPRYGASIGIATAMRDAFAENDALKQLWLGGKSSDPSDAKENEKDSRDLLIEAIEFCLLDKLSVTTTDFFNGTKSKYSEVYEGEKLSTLILNNRFIKLFSEPMENRTAFNSIKKNKIKGRGEVIAVYTNSGRYQKFEFNLPKGAKISKPNKKTVVFDFKFFKLSISIEPKDYTANVPIDFIKYYVGLKDDWRKLTCKSFIVNIGISEKTKSIFYPFKKKEYQWIDNYLNNMLDYLSFNHFLETINWNALQAQLTIDQNAAKVAPKDNNQKEQA